jgi:hypothetical protein
MSLDQNAPQGLSVVSATPENAEPSNESGENRYEGFTSPDEPESAEQPATSEEQGTEIEGEEAQGEPDPWEGYEDYELNGVVKKVPSEWKEHLMLKADHTRRLQELAETKKQVQAREAEISQRFQQTEEEFNAHVELANLRNQLKAAEGINWNAEYQKILNDPNLRNDPLGQQEAINQFNAVHMQWRELKEREALLQQTTNDLANKRIEFGSQEVAKRLSATREFAQTKIKGWTPELDEKITQFAMSEGGYDAETLMKGMTPQNYKMLHLAYLGHQSQIRQQSAKPTLPVKPAGPTQTVTTKANVMPSFDPEKSSMDDYAKDWAARQARKAK